MLVRKQPLDSLFSVTDKRDPVVTVRAQGTVDTAPTFAARMPVCLAAIPSPSVIRDSERNGQRTRNAR